MSVSEELFLSAKCRHRRTLQTTDVFYGHSVYKTTRSAIE